jgi:hypothetical protein
VIERDCRRAVFDSSNDQFLSAAPKMVIVGIGNKIKNIICCGFLLDTKLECLLNLH